MKTALFRVDGFRSIGMGHIMRCLAFAQGLRKTGMESLFVVRDYGGNVQELIHDHEYEVKSIPHGCSYAEDASLTSACLSEYDAKFAVSDLSHSQNMENKEAFTQYYQMLKSSGTFLITIDHPDKTDFAHDIQIIPYYGIDKSHYKVFNSSKLLLGPAYFIFREEFIRAAGVKRRIKKNACNILVTMGGSDTIGLTRRVIETLCSLSSDYPDIDIKSVIGPGFIASAGQEVEEISRQHHVNCQTVTGKDNMAELMLWADLIITAGGLTKYEAALVGTPCIIISSSDEEAQMTDKFAESGAVWHLGSFDSITEEAITGAVDKLLKGYDLRVDMSVKGKKMVDGKGIERIIA